jgi:hypothetical protein
LRTVKVTVQASIPDYAFENCDLLTSVTFPNSITSIGKYAFKNCSKLSTLAFIGTMEQWNALSFGTDWRANVPATKVICSDGEIPLS